MADFNWEGNTKEIFDLITSLSPKPFRKRTIQMLSDALEAKVGKDQPVTEEIIVACIKEVTPKPFLPMGMKKIKHLLKNP